MIYVSDWRKIHSFLKTCLDIAEWHDRKGEEDKNWWGGELCKEIGLGYKVLTAHLRVGVEETIKLQDEYHHAAERRWLAESHEGDMQEFLKEIFGEEEPESLNDEITEKIRKATREIIDEWEKEHCSEEV